jgi:HEAT repeat protein
MRSLRPVRLRLVLIAGAAVVIHGMPAFIPQAWGQAPPLPSPEIFARSGDLRLSLQVEKDSIRVGEPLALTLRFENRGTKPLYVVPRPLNPTVVAQPRVVAFSQDDDASAALGARRVAIRITREQLVTLNPKQHWDVPVDSLTLRPLRRAPGEYTVTVTYVNYPDYNFVHYDPYTMPTGIWEGVVSTGPIRFTVRPPAQAELAQQVARLRSGTADDLALSLLALSSPEGVAALVQQFTASPASRTGSQILFALRQADSVPLSELLAAIETSPADQRRSVLSSYEFLSLVQDRVTCDVLELLATQLDVFVGPRPSSFDTLFRVGAPRCPNVRTQLRSTVLNPSRTLYARQHAAALLGTFHNANDLPLLLDILDQRQASMPPPSAGDGDPIRAGAVSALGQFGEPEVLETLARALADEQRNSSIGSALADALYKIGGPNAVPPLIGALSSSNTTLVHRAIGWLGALRATTAVPQLLGLLRHSDPTIRTSAAGAIRQLGDNTVRNSMVAATNDIGAVQANALFFLAEHGDASLRDLFIAGLESPTQFVREAAIMGIGRFGTEDDFPRLRRLFDLPRPDVHGYLPSALGALTFVSWGQRQFLKAEQWDDWYEQHRTATRVEWALEALRQTDQQPRMSPFDAFAERQALAFLVTRRNREFLPDFHRAAQTSRFAVRVEAARAIAAFDRRSAGQLLIREFTGRFLAACDAANRALNELTGLNRSINCREPDARSEAVATWNATVSAY